MAFSEIDDRDAEQIGGGVARFLRADNQLFTPATFGPRMVVTNNRWGSGTGGAYNVMIAMPPVTGVWVGGRLGFGFRF